MPRPAATRPPAQPTSQLQLIKYQRMLDAAAARLSEPTEKDRALIRLIHRQWFAITQACLGGHLTIEVAEADLVLACELLLAPLSSAQQWRELSPR